MASGGEKRDQSSRLARCRRRLTRASRGSPPRSRGALQPLLGAVFDPRCGRVVRERLHLRRQGRRPLKVGARRHAAPGSCSPTRGRGVSPAAYHDSGLLKSARGCPARAVGERRISSGIAESSRQPFTRSARNVQLQGRRPASRLGYHRVHAPAREPMVASASRRLDRVSRGPKPRINNRR